MSNLMGNTSLPNYVKITATLILGSTYVAALAVAVDTYIVQGPAAAPPAIVTMILGTGIGMALQALGMHQGASLLESPSPAQNGAATPATDTPATPATPAPGA